MKTLKYILPMLAFVFAIAGAFVTKANEPVAAGFAQILDDPATTTVNEKDCVPGNTDESNTCNGTGAQCHITIAGDTWLAYTTDNGVSCATAMRLN